MSVASTASYQCIRRNGDVVPFAPDKISVALSKAFLAVLGSEAGGSSRLRDEVEHLTATVVAALIRRRPEGGPIHIEDIQDQVELALMRAGEQEVARAYVLYRERRAAERRAAREALGLAAAPTLHVTRADGSRAPLDLDRMATLVHTACIGLEADTDPAAILGDTLKNLYDGVSEAEVGRAVVMCARQMIERDPAYDKVTARLLLDSIRGEVLGRHVAQTDMAALYADAFPGAIQRGIQAELLDPRLGEFDLARLGQALNADADLQFGYLGLQTLYDRYFLHIEGRRIELPQTFFMRVAMGLALNEAERNDRAIEFYRVLSSFDFMSSTPTLFNAGTLHSQLSSCYLTTLGDDLTEIFDGIKENALLSKYAGGLGNDWTPVRSLGSHIKGTNGKSQGVVPFLKVANDTAVAVNQGGKRKGAVCAYLETWHADIEEFLELRKNTGDDRRRTHDMNTANWVPDLFMQRVMEDGPWSLFSPSETPDLHDLTGKAFARRYAEYEAMGERGELRVYKRLRALDLWRKMLTMLFETGHPWLTFKDPCNLRSPQQHMGVVHSSNLCTEITLNTSDSEIAVCNLGSVNLANHIRNGQLDDAKLAGTVRTAMRMLDNVIDLNFYPVEKARNANMRHRPVGMGLMGFQDALHALGLAYGSDAAVEFADRSMESIAYHAYWASTSLAEERGTYQTYDGSLWSRGILPHDSLDLLAESRGGWLEVDRSTTLDWDRLRARIKQFGMRNSNCLAIAPTATIANIIGVSASIEPTYKNLFVKSNLSGEFTVVNEYLVRDLKRLGLWDKVMLADLKYFDGDLGPIERIPAEVKALYATAFDLDPSWLVEAASRRQKWIDQAQSLNLYMAGASGKKLDTLYKHAWVRGLKTTYYLRTLAATSAEKSTGRGGELNAVPVAAPPAVPATDMKFCSIDNPDCESCQ
ncbi:MULTISPECIES: ribonucleoside-diphosphate reductase subunit alpha [Microvirgula]|uniref:Ribonucleoside-diphosphate reductase n=1 Tax=Microvirgula aerodenitrificans TaxID=57480 RepID=A0A2S0PBU4_9NEIS|nr:MULTISPECIES: ribonucleoside-diphosphate reductase subunit alpha [Microvirgula]AVY94859.1 ribonucleoside-diphosphate reductase subunit alpha [Microvirgula aerodenitrificans]RAS17242.1 ribonucleoside-diphosphate reductase class II [Microvirgula sp. AG722]